MVDKFVGRFMPKRDTLDVRGTVNDILNLFKDSNSESGENNWEQENSTSFTF